VVKPLLLYIILISKITPEVINFQDNHAKRTNGDVLTSLSLSLPCLSFAIAAATQYRPLSMDFVSQEHGVPRDRPKDSNAGG
jgi:hypothetical protein